MGDYVDSSGVSCRQQSRGPRATAGHDHLDQEAHRSHGEWAIGEPGTGDSAALVTEAV